MLPEGFLLLSVCGTLDSDMRERTSDRVEIADSFINCFRPGVFLITNLVLYAMTLQRWIQSSLDTVDQMLTDGGIFASLYQHIGTTGQRYISRLRNGTIFQLFGRRKVAFRRQDATDRQNICTALEKARREEREKRYREFTMKLHHLGVSEQAKLINAIKKKRQRGKPSALSQDEGSLASYAAYFSSMYARRDFQVPSSSPLTIESSSSECPFKNILMAPNRTPKAKVRRFSGIRSEYLSPVLIPIISVIFSVAWHIGIIPSSWKSASIVDMPKAFKAPGSI